MERERRRDGGLGGTKRAEDFIALEDGGEEGGRLLREDENDSDGADEDFDDLRVMGMCVLQQQQQQQQQLMRVQGRRVNMDGFSKLTQQVAPKTLAHLTHNSSHTSPLSSSSVSLLLMCCFLSFEKCKRCSHFVIDPPIDIPPSHVALTNPPFSTAIHNPFFLTFFPAPSTAAAARGAVARNSSSTVRARRVSVGVVCGSIQNPKPLLKFKKRCSSPTVFGQQPRFGSCPTSMC